MRVVAGSAKGRRLKAPKTAGTRPVMDRVKTALFDTLGGDVRGARFLDLFAGTGGIGIEALSRGAQAATFVELGAEALACVRENLATTRLAAGAETLRADAFEFLKQAAVSGRRYDIVYIAPPQYRGMARRALQALDAEPLTEPGGLVIVQIHPHERPEFDALALTHLEPVDERRYGSTALIYYEHRDPEETREGVLENVTPAEPKPPGENQNASQAGD